MKITFPAVLCAPVAGKVVQMDSIPDPTFSQGMLGICVGIEPEESVIHAPVAGKVTQLADTLHAIGMEVAGMEILIHIGVDTVDMEGEGFSASTKEGRIVEKGDPLVKVDVERVRSAGHSATVIMAVTNSDNFAGVHPVAQEHVACGDPLLEVKKN